MANVFLDGLALRYYRGIGDSTQYIGPFKSFNFFIGPNNAGKSTVLNYLSKYVSVDKIASVPPVDNYRGKNTGSVWSAIGVTESRALARTSDIELKKAIVELIVGAMSQDGMIWLQRSGRADYSLASMPTIQEWQELLSDSNWSAIWQTVTGRSMGSLQQHWVPETIGYFMSAIRPNIPDVLLIPGIREIGAKGTSFDYNGSGLIDRLAEIQSPDHDRREDRVLFDRINTFLQTVVGNDDAVIEIPHNRDHILVHMDSKVLPLSSLGMGIHEVVMIAAFCTISQEKIVCIEEPEIHLHPLLQRKLVSYLSRNTSNQYFIATHSAAFIDTEGAAIFHVKNDGAQTTITEAVLRKQRYELCADLGYRASDILQSNAVVWVEGPSDRIYLRWWLSALAPDLVEGTQFSIMFYGGRLLNHLTADDDEVGEFIALRSLNRNSAIVIDSDRHVIRGPINETKTRIRSEFSADGDEFCWITAGREIENYIGFETLQRAVAGVYGDVYARGVSGGQFDHALHFYRKAAKKRRRQTQLPVGVDPLLETSVDKVAVAKAVTSGKPDFSVLDLKKRVQGIVEIIRRANR